MRLLELIAATSMSFAAMAQTPRVELIERARRLSLEYSASLPDFLCIQHIRRSVRWREAGEWSPADTLTVQVTYFKQKESYKLLQHNWSATNQSYAAIAGAVSLGEFGSMLRWVFDPTSQTEFQEQKHRPRAAVFEYRVRAANSRYKIVSGTQEATAGYHGVVEIDPQTAHVARLSMVAELPKDFPILESSSTVEYGAVRIEGHEYLLPVHAEAEAADVPHGQPRPTPPFAASPLQVTHYRNVIEFRDYKRFTVDSHLIAR